MQSRSQAVLGFVRRFSFPLAVLAAGITGIGCLGGGLTALLGESGHIVSRFILWIPGRVMWLTGVTSIFTKFP